jgi:hypothetical protein
MKCLSLVLSTLAIATSVSAQSLNYPLLWWDQYTTNTPQETSGLTTEFDGMSALKTASAG